MSASFGPYLGVLSSADPNLRGIHKYQQYNCDYVRIILLFLFHITIIQK